MSPRVKTHQQKMALLTANIGNICQRGFPTRVVAHAINTVLPACYLQILVPYYTLGLSSSFVAFLVYVGLLVSTTQNLKAEIQFGG